MRDAAPDLILHGGSVRTMGPAGSMPTALAIVGDRILALGGDRDVLGLREGRTRVIDLRGRTVLPGFTDAHVHPISGGLRHVECDLDRFDTVAEHLAAVAAYAASHPELEWIVGDGWSMETFPGGIPRRELLDDVVPDRPVFLTNRDGHGAWVNTRALEVAGVTAATPDPPTGRIERDPDGTPVGMLQESAMKLVRTLIPNHGHAVIVRAIIDAQAELHALGITGWQDANVNRDEVDAYRAVAASGALTARVVLSMGAGEIEGFGGIDGLVAVRDAVAAAARSAAPGSSGPARLQSTSIKFFVDGVLENRTGALLDPYLDGQGEPTGGIGMTTLEPIELARLSVALDGRGFQLHYHAIGDRAVREALDAIAAARAANGARDARHHVAHIQLIHPDDLPRFAALGAIANAQPLWAVHEAQMDKLTIPFLGPERARWQYPFGSLLRAGARLAFGSDWTVSTANPFPQIEVAVTRVWPELREATPFLAAERITLDQALTAATVGSAFVNRQDDAGWLGVARLADIAILDRNIDASDAGPIGDTTVVGTLVGGEFVFEAPALEG